MKSRPSGNHDEGCQGTLRQKRHKHKRHRQWQRFKRKLPRQACGFNKFNERYTAPIMNPSSFWENYSNVLKWQQDYCTSYWKFRAISLENEVHHLRQELSQYRRGTGHKHVSNNRNESEDCILINSDNSEHPEERTVETEEDEDIVDDDDEIEECDFELVVSEEMQLFLNDKEAEKSQDVREDTEAVIDQEHSKDSSSEEEITMSKNSHQIKQKSQSMVSADSLSSIDEVDGTSLEEMNRLYGIHSTTIRAMETSVQLSYLSFRRKTNPSYWPNLPFEMKFK